MAIQDWMPIFNWKGVPSFSDIHELSEKDFDKLYFRSDPNLTGFIDNLLENLQGDYPSGALRIQAPPGWGKTSFFHYLRRITNRQKIARYIQIFDANELASSTGIDKGGIFLEVLSTLINYFDNCCTDENIANDTKNNSNLSDQEKVRSLVGFVRNNEIKFSKRLVVIIDNVDILSQEHVLEFATTVFQLFQTNLIIKWLAIRDVTFEKYSELARDQIATLFPGLYLLPNIPLFEIAKLRIKHVGQNSVINPFSKKLCAQIQQLSGGDHRQGLAALLEISQSCSPKDLSRTALIPDDVRSLFERKAIPIFLRRGILPNLFRPELNTSSIIPLTREVMNLLYYRTRIDDVFISLLNESISTKISAISRDAFPHVKVIRKDVNESAEHLSKLNLISFSSPDNIHITKIGYAVRDYIVDQEFYVKECRETLVGVQEDSLFWKQAILSSGFRQMLMKNFFGRVIEHE